MALAGPFASTRCRPAFASSFCLVLFFLPFSAHHCFAWFCPPCCRLGLPAAPAGIPSGSGFCAYGKLLLFSLRCAPLGVSRMEKFVGIFARCCKNSRGLTLQFSGSENSSGLLAVAHLRPTSYQPANRSAHEGCPAPACFYLGPRPKAE